MKNKSILNSIITTILASTIILGGLFFLPWHRAPWSKLIKNNPSTIRVNGTAQKNKKNEMAIFTAGVNVYKDDKQEAIDEVNQKVDDLINAVKNFGIDQKDIKTQNISVYQRNEPVEIQGKTKMEEGQWSASNNIEITLREVDRASALTDVLTDSGATNVHGPRFQMSDQKVASDDLIAEAVKNAREKAEAIAAANNQKIVKVLDITEGSGSNNFIPMYESRAMGLGAGAPVEPGSTNVRKQVSVVFEVEDK